MSISQKIIYFLVFLVCLAIQTLPVIRSGLTYDFGIGYWGPSGHDGVWHLALINHIQNPLQINLPIMSGENLTNYHPLFNILIATLSKLTNIPSNLWLFQIFPIISAAIFIHLSYLVGSKFLGGYNSGIYLVCLNSFANSLGWLVTLIRGQGIGGESLFWAMQSASNQINPPYLLSLIMLLYMLYLLPKTSGRLSHRNSIQIVIIFTLLPIAKAYSIIPATVILLVYSIHSIKKNIYQPTIIFLLSLACSIIVFLYFNPKSSGLLTFSPFWFSKSLVESTDRLYLPLLASQLHLSPNTPWSIAKLLFSYFISFTLFIIGNYSFRLIGFYNLKLRNSWPLQSLFLSILLLTLVPTLFVQKGTAWNTIQFIYYGLFFANFFLARLLASQPVLALTILLINLISNYSNFQNSLGFPPPAKLSHEELIALKFLKNQKLGTVLTYPFDKHIKNNFSTPIPLYAYETTSYVSAYSHQKTFVDDYMNLSNSGYDYQSRLDSSQKFFQQQNKFANRGFLLNNQIDYIYLAGLQKEKANLDTNNLFLTKIFENNEAVIFQVQK